MLQSEFERVKSATKQQIFDFSARIKNIEKYALPDEENSEQKTMPCFCCDQEVTHQDHSGDGIFAEAYVGKNGFKSILLHLDCEDHPLVWRESNDGYTYIIVVGDQGPLGLTPETTKYDDSNK
ncbi:hypothetical protein ASD24_29500 [Paenibacillus sp. Root52]|uniref:hypothetical protein n=1 Tax=Paenibacillus sp. Root52 TaxID=1736552 RepID=UPI0006F84442|nr:hypothetical protein [Paenibacillus sp. Root52]KQY83745.1 hypothetical protein ASD24_29500 [Paenibacillus sp. Root52]